MANLKDLSKKELPFTAGHRACVGCGIPVVVKEVLLASDAPVVASCATGCLEVTSTIYPYTAWNISFVHSAFENSAATISGVEAAFNSLKRQGKIPTDRKINFVAFGGDGGTYDIGFQSLSGAMERGHNMLYVCYNNQAYMNTGIQRSSATPKGAFTTTRPVGKILSGKKHFSKNLTECMVAHDVVYVAQGCVSYWNDLITKSQKAFSMEGPKFINVLQPCQLGWGYDPADTIEIGKLAVETCFWPLYEVAEGGEYKITYKPKEKKPIVEFLKTQVRFKHLFTPENKHIIDEIQIEVDRRWNRLLKLCTNP